MAFSSILAVIILSLFLLTVLACVIDLITYYTRRRYHTSLFGRHINQTYKVISQDEKHGSKLENGLSLYDVYTERGMTTFRFQIGDQIKILPFSKFKPFQQTLGLFQKIDHK